MAKTMHSERDRAEIAERIARLTPDRKGVWGKMSAAEMLVHLTDGIRMATGALPVPFKKTVMRFPILRKLLIYVLPWPKGAPTAPELRSRIPAAWAGEQETFSREMKNFTAKDKQGAWPIHPIFGNLSAEEWGALGYKHCDHHLRQFGL